MAMARAHHFNVFFQCLGSQVSTHFSKADDAYFMFARIHRMVFLLPGLVSFSSTFTTSTSTITFTASAASSTASAASTAPAASGKIKY